MPKDIWDAANVAASLSRFLAIGELAAREYLTTLDDADATWLWKCLRRLGWWFPDDQQSAQERLVWWLFRDDVTRLDFSDGTERRRIETSAERLDGAFRDMKSLAQWATIPAGSCLSVANYVRGVLCSLERNELPLGPWAIRCGSPEHYQSDFSRIRFDGECLNDALNAAAKQLGLQPGQLHWQEATGHWFTTERREFDDVRRLLTDWRDVLEREIRERSELPSGWEATDTTWPDCPIKSVEVLREWLSSWLATIHSTRSSGSWSRPESYLDDVQRELRNTRRAMRAWGVSLPPQFNANPGNIIEAEEQLELLIDLLGATEKINDVPTEQQLNLARNLALEANHKAHSLPAWFRYQETPAVGWNAEPHRIIDTLAKLAADLDAALTDVVTGWLHRWNCGEESALEIGGRSFHTAHEAALECVSRALTAFKNAEQRGQGSKVELPPTMLTPDRFVPWEWDHEQLNKQIEREWGRAIRRLPDAARGVVSQPPKSIEPSAMPVSETWPPDNGWHFRTREAAFLGLAFEIGGKPFETLKALATARRGQTIREIGGAVSPDTDPVASTIRGYLADVRKKLREVFVVDRNKADDSPIIVKGKGDDALWSLVSETISLRVGSTQ